MTIDDVTLISSQALFLIIKTAAPVLLISLAVGLTVSIFQTVTSIQEQTMTFVPKVLSIFLTIMVLGHWMLNNIMEFMTSLWQDFNIYLN
jgi:flagellar biosynthetic protein FliQ